MQAERIAANPPLITAYNPAIENRAEDQFGENFFVGNSDKCLNRAEAVYERTAQQQAVFRENMRTWEEHTGMDAHQEFGAVAARAKGENERLGAVPPVWARDWRGSEMPWSRQYYLAPTRSIVQQQLPRVRGDLVNLSDQSMNIVCGVLNVPRGLLGSDMHVRAGVEAVGEAMNRTLMRWADILGSLMTGVYNHTFGYNDLRFELRIRMEQRRRTPYDVASRVLTEQDVFEAEAKTRVRLAFDLAPATTAERLDDLYNRGIIAWSTYGTAQLRLNHFRRDQLASTQDPLTKQEQRQLLFGRPDKPEGSGTKKTSATKRTAEGAKTSTPAKKSKTKEPSKENKDEAAKETAKQSK